jgi:phage N-6-adenine-methyltransferase
MTIQSGTFLTQKRTKTVRKGKRIGRPPIRKNGVVFSAAEHSKRYRDRQRQKRKQTELLKTCQWNAPKNYIEAVRKVMGGIDVDPASSDIAQTVVKAKTFYTAENDGLTKEWHGRVWINPPYSKGLLTKFVDKLLEEIAAGRTQQAILLVQSSSVGTAWFNRVTEASNSFCLPSKRIFFWSPDAPDGFTPNGNKAGLMFGSVIFYFGSKSKQFEAVFKKFGTIVVA